MEQKNAVQEDPRFFKALAKRVVDAWESMNIKNVAPFFSKDPSLIFFDAAPLKYIGWETYEKASAENFTGRFIHQKFALYDDAVVRQIGNMAFTAFTLHLDVTTAEGKKIAEDGRVTIIWEKQGNEWLIVHEHLSISQTLPPLKKSNKTE